MADVERRRLRDHRDRRHRRRHRVAAVPGGDPPVPGRCRPAPVHVHPPDARPLHRPRRRAEDEADAALGQRAATHRHRARHGRVPVGVEPARRRSGARSRCSPACRSRPSSRPYDVATSTSVPLAFHERGRRRLHPARALRARGAAQPDLGALAGDHRAGRARHRRGRRIALVGKYVQLEDAYLSVVEALRHARRPPRLPRRRSTGSTRSRSTSRRSTRELRGGRRHPDPRRLRRPRLRGQDRRCRDRARGRDPIPRRLSRHARRGQRVRPPRRRTCDGRELDRDGPRDALPGDRPAARAEGDRRHGRDDAARRRPDQAPRGHARPRDLRRGGHLRAPPPPLRGQQPPAPARGARARVLAARPRTSASSR